MCRAGFRLRAPKGQARHWFLREQVTRDPVVFRGACGDRQGPRSLRPAQNTPVSGMGRAAMVQGRAELAGGAYQLFQDAAVILTNVIAPSTAPLRTAVHLHAGPQQDAPHLYVFLELSSLTNPPWIVEEDMDFLEI